MKGRSILTLCLVMVIGAALFLAGNALGATPKRGGTLTVVHGVDISYLDVHTAPGYETVWINMNTHNSLLTLDKDLKPAPDLAKKWEVSPDGLVYTFYLHEGVKFHDGTDMDAEAVKWNIEHVLNPENRVFIRPFYTEVDRVEVVDRHTVRVILKEPNYMFPLVVSGYRMGFVVSSPTAFKTLSEQEYRMKPVGTGPFKFLEHVPNDRLVLVRNENYFKKGLPYLDKVVFKVLGEPMTQVSALRAGEVDLLNSVSPELVRVLERDRNITVLSGLQTTPMVAFLQVSRPPFDDLRVRKAIGCYGIDRREIAEKALLGLAVPLVAMAPVDTKGYVDLTAMCPYDTEKARALLKEAGYDERNPLRYTILTNNEKAVFHNIATLLKEQYKKLGVETKVEIQDKVTWMTYMVGKHRCQWEQTVEDLASILTVHHNSYISVTTARANLACHTDTKVDALYREIQLAPTEAERQKIGEVLQRHIVENMLWVNVTTSPHFKAHRKHVKDFVYQGEFKFLLEKVWLDK
ncbi:MAG: ABC transporter substrate-binding protein [Nitrospinae bacterium]|nr:ABC transporter substrate-binding protein [Nitrospinota bacterium]